MDAKERYEEKRSDESPVLIIGNTYDGFTPLVSARNVRAGLRRSRVLEVRGYGVCNPFPCTPIGFLLKISSIPH
jgi:pimeloyl-ACP methyl ester carboxylesterase